MPAPVTPPTPEPTVTPTPPAPTPPTPPAPTPPTPPARPSTPIVDAAAAAFEKHKAAQQDAIQAAAVGKAKGTLTSFLAGELNPDDLTWSYVDGGSVVASDGTYNLSVDPQQRVWLVQPEGDGWAEAQQVGSLVDAARLLGLT